jgi:hypothetical protein
MTAPADLAAPSPALVTPVRVRRAIVALAAAALLIALLDGLICARAGFGRTGSWSFPIDDAYIYANYTRALLDGRPFQYNPGEVSGGVTGAGWMLLLATAEPLTHALGDLPAGLAPTAVRAADPATALVAGRLYLAAYAWGALLLAGAAAACAWLAHQLYRGRPGATAWAPLAGAALLADHNAIWGAYSGLEIPLSLLLAALAPATLLADLRRSHAGRADGLRWSLLAAALLPWARPELAIIALAGALWLGWGAARGWATWRAAGAYLAAAGAGLATLLTFYWMATGRPLPSSFYAKVGGPSLGAAPAALQEWVAAGAWQPFTLLALAAFGAAALWRVRRDSGEWPARRPAALMALACALYLGAMLIALRWFGQEDRYILPLHALAIPLVVGLPAALLGWPQAPATLSRRARRAALLAGAGLALLVHIVTLRVWAATDYSLFVQNIEDAHVAPALWLRAHTPPGTVIAAEPIGAVRLFSDRPTVDIVGLTTPAQLGHYGDWAATAALLRARGAGYLLYYPRAWPGGRLLPWAREAQRFPVPDNRMAGDDPIAVYRLAWP